MRCSDMIVLSNVVAELVILTALTAAVPLVVSCDVCLLQDGVGECSLTEVSQELLLALSMLGWLVALSRYPEGCGFPVLVAGFLACMLIRELDFVFDVISHGAWVWAALAVVVATLGYAWHFRSTIVPGIVAYVGNRSCTYLWIGLLFTLLFSRLYGSGALLWTRIMGPGYNTVVKASIQEGLELYGYSFIACASCLLFRNPAFRIRAVLLSARRPGGACHDEQGLSTKDRKNARCFLERPTIL